VNAPQNAPAVLTDRQQRERDYHRQFAERAAKHFHAPPALDILADPSRRWWLSNWKAYEFLLRTDLHGKRVFVPGCGFGGDAIRLATLGAEVYASDISPEQIELARQRAERAGVHNINFGTLPAEDTGYSDAFFDLALFVGVFHHIDIPSALRELRRIMKPGAALIAREVYSHSATQRLRENRLIDRVLYPAMSRFIYGSMNYITEDERKLNQHDLDLIRDAVTEFRVEYFDMAAGRLFPSAMTALCRADRAALKTFGAAGRVLAGRVVIAARM
jgi:ubiquinone/menaquinone biosynthesis C-methylase UbiE